MINDTYGHDVGDDILRKLAITMKNLLVKMNSLSDMVAKSF